MKSASFALGSLLAAVAIAQPHRQHQAFHHKRDPALVWVTEVDTVFETVGYTTTIWVSEGYVPPKSTKPKTTSTNTPIAAQFFEPARSSPSSTPSPPAPAPAPSSSSSVYVAPAPVITTPVVVPTTSAAPAPVYVAPVESSKPVAVAAAPVAAVDTPEPAPYVAPASPAPVAAPVASTPPSSGSGGGSGGPCSKASPCEGDITHYDTSLDVYGACGFQNDGLTEKVIALPHELMGAQSNGNPYCGKKVTIVCGGKSIIATVVDKCMGCTGKSIDLSDAAFKELAEMGVGRTTASWYFN